MLSVCLITSKINNCPFNKLANDLLAYWKTLYLTKEQACFRQNCLRENLPLRQLTFRQNDRLAQSLGPTSLKRY